MPPEIKAQRAVCELYFEMAGDQIMGAQSLREIAFIADYLGDKGGSEKKAALIVIADGMAGSSARQIVASLVSSTFNKTFIRGYGHTAPPKLLRASLDKANTTLSETVRVTPELTGMACTLVSAALIGEELNWASVGDSHVYLIRDSQLHKLNADHSYGGYLERLRADGMEVEADADIAPDMLMSAVNGEAISEIDCREQAFMLRANDRLLMASRGLNTLDNNTILRTSAICSDAKGCVAALLRGVKEIGEASHANTTVIVVDVFDRNEGDASKTSTVGDNSQSSAAHAATAGATVQAAAPPSRRSILLDTLTAVGAVLIFVGAAFASWQGLGYLNEFRRAADPSADVTRTANSLPSPAPVPQNTAAPGLSFGAPPSGGVAPTARGTGASLSFGAPAPPPSPTATPAPNDALPSAPMHTAAGEVFRDPLSAGGDGPLMVPIPAGQFQMGSKARAQERPAHPVTIEAFAISRFEVTVEQYERFARDSKRKMPNIDTLDDKKLIPVNGVSWDDAHAYTRWLSVQTGKRYRLPSEAQWEHAASGGVANAYWWGPTAGEGRAHCKDCKTGLDPRRATRIGRFEANPFTLFDTAGNVAEWVHDCWHPNYRDAPEDGSVWEGGDCTLRVVRGGSFSSPSGAIRTQARAHQSASEGVSSVGFRVARDL